MVTDRSGDVIELKLSGRIEAQFDLEPVDAPQASRIVVDLKEVERINSVGVRRWTRFVDELQQTGCDIVFERCSSAMVQQFNMIPATYRSAKIRSVMLPYQCEACGHFTERLYDDRPPNPDSIAEEIDCPECDDVMWFDDLPEFYFAFWDES